MNYIHEIFREYLNFFVMIYVNDILIFSTNQKKHDEHVRFVFERLRQYELFAKLNKCEFDVQEMIFLNYIVKIKNIRMNSNRIKTITKWSIFRCYKNVQIFLKFVNFYKKFIKKFNRIIAKLSDLLKNNKKSKFTFKFVYTAKVEAAFEKFKRLFIQISLLWHFDSEKKILIKTNVFNYAVFEILFQWNDETKQWHSVIFTFRKMNSVEKNYDAKKKKMLIIMKICKQWRHYVKNAKHSIKIFTNYNNLRDFFKNKALSRREIQW